MNTGLKFLLKVFTLAMVTCVATSMQAQIGFIKSYDIDLADPSETSIIAEVIQTSDGGYLATVD